MNQSATGLLELANLHSVMLVNLPTIASGTSNDVTSTTVDTVRRPWLDPPEGYAPFDYQGGVALPAAPSGFVVVPMEIPGSTTISIIVPDGWDGVITGFNANYIGAGFTPFSGDIVWQITRNGAPVRGFDNIINEKGSLEAPRMISPIRIYSKQIVNLLVNHAANAALNGSIVGGFVGYFYPSKG